jgi:hypothetical protein
MSSKAPCDPKYSGMTVNERLYASGLIDEFDIARKTNKRRAMQILQDLSVDDSSIEKILEPNYKISKPVLLKAICNYYTDKAIADLKDEHLPTELIEKIKERAGLQNVFLFTNHDLLNHLRVNPQDCDRLVGESYDKRFTPSTFIEGTGTSYTVGYFDKKKEQVKIWNNIVEATADYLLLSWNLGRLDKD